MHCCEVDFMRFFNVSVGMFDKHALATTFRTDKQEIFIVSDPLFKSFEIALSHYCAQ